MAKRGKVSILMNCYNGEDYLSEALVSILSQSYIYWELIFWDNCSTDNTAKIFNSFQDSRFKYFLAKSHTNLGEARASAWNYLDGEFIAFLDSDDIWFSNKLEEQLKLFDDPVIGISITNSIFFSEKSERLLYKSSNAPNCGLIFEDQLRNYTISFETVMVRMSIAKKFKLNFDPLFSHISDFDFIIRFCRVAKLAYSPKTLSKWRVHLKSATWAQPEKFSEEQEKWIQKINKENLNKTEKIALTFFENKRKQKLIYKLLLENKLQEVKEVVKHLNKMQLISFLILVVCTLPYSAKLVSKIDKYKKSRWFD